MNNVQIPFSLFLDLYQYFVIGTGDKEAIREQIEVKAKKIMDREAYSRYKTAETETEREKARTEYLDRKEVPEDYRW